MTAVRRYPATPDELRDEIARAERLAAHLEAEMAADRSYLVNRPSVARARQRAEAYRAELRRLETLPASAGEEQAS